MKGLKLKYFLAKMYSNNLFNLKHKKYYYLFFTVYVFAFMVRIFRKWHLIRNKNKQTKTRLQNDSEMHKCSNR